MSHPGRRKEWPSGRVAVTVSTPDRFGEARFSAVQATGVTSSRSSNQARKCFYHRGTRKNDRVHRVGKEFGASRKNLIKPSRAMKAMAAWQVI